MRATEITVNLQRLPHRLMGGLLLCSLISCQPTQPPADSMVSAPAGDHSVADDTVPSDTDTAALSTEAPPPPPSNSYLAHLSPNVANQLVNLGINIVIPTYLTPNMTLANYGVSDTSNGEDPYYWLVYRDDQNRCFAIEYATSRIRTSSLENQAPIDSALFGDGYRLHHGKFIDQRSESDLFTDWLVGNDGFYRLIGAGLVNAQNYEQNTCSNITVEEAINITESLSYLPTDIRTLDAIPPDF
ncbi:MAG: hypothetical protein ACFB14_02365 [Leptolyngbyaceae cyanobacterium]